MSASLMNRISRRARVLNYNDDVCDGLLLRPPVICQVSLQAVSEEQPRLDD